MLEGLPKQKFHCSNLGAQALNKAIDDYLIKTGKIKAEGNSCCPFCDHEEGEDDPLCTHGCSVAS